MTDIAVCAASAAMLAKFMGDDVKGAKTALCVLVYVALINNSRLGCQGDTNCCVSSLLVIDSHYNVLMKWYGEIETYQRFFVVNKLPNLNFLQGG